MAAINRGLHGGITHGELRLATLLPPGEETRKTFQLIFLRTAAFHVVFVYQQDYGRGGCRIFESGGGGGGGGARGSSFRQCIGNSIFVFVFYARTLSTDLKRMLIFKGMTASHGGSKAT